MKNLDMLILFAHWCPICNMMLPIIDDIEKDYVESIRFRKVDVEKHPEMMEQYDAQIVPTFLVFKEQREIARMAGMIGEHTFRARIETLMKGEK